MHCYVAVRTLTGLFGGIFSPSLLAKLKIEDTLAYASVTPRLASPRGSYCLANPVNDRSPFFPSCRSATSRSSFSRIVTSVPASIQRHAARECFSKDPARAGASRRNETSKVASRHGRTFVYSFPSGKVIRSLSNMQITARVMRQCA